MLFSFWHNNTNRSLYFSDGAKFADVARNLVSGRGYASSFTFWDTKIFSLPYSSYFSAAGIPQLMPRMIALTFNIFGVSDASVILTSSFHFLLLIIATFMLGNKLYGKLAGLLAGLTVAANINFIDYAVSGASEPMFSFLVVIGAYLILLKKKWANFLLVLILILMYLARPQAIIFIGGLSVLFLFLNLGFKKGVYVSMGLFIAMYLFDKMVLYPLSFRLPVYPIFIRGLQAIFTYSSASATSDALRGAVIPKLTALQLLSKVFYNLYNFYRLVPRIMSPYLFAFFVVGLFEYSKDRKLNYFKLFTVIAFAGTLIIYAFTIPLFRYIHPIVPLVYIAGTGALVSLLRKTGGRMWTKYGTNLKHSKRFMLGKQTFVILVSLLLIAIFAIGQSLGIIFLDTRFEESVINRGKPPTYVLFGQVLKDNTDTDDLVLTNLDTWGSWYGKRRSAWFPIEPTMIVDAQNSEIPFDAIYLTSYLMDDENYYMGESWRIIFNKPETRSILSEKGFVLKGEFNISATDNYENKPQRAVLLVKTKNI
jgi:hypothetical protein